MNTPSLSILLVEPERASADALRRVLESAQPPFGVRVLHSLREFTELARQSPPDLALLNLAIPGERVEDFLSLPPESGAFPVLVLASPGDEGAALAAVARGALDFVLNSSAVHAELPRAIHRALREWALRRALRRATEELRRLTNLVEERRKVGHDFNNLLGTIVGNAELARADLDPQHPARESLDEIVKASLAAKQQIRVLLGPPDQRVAAPLLQEPPGEGTGPTTWRPAPPTRRGGFMATQQVQEEQAAPPAASPPPPSPAAGRVPQADAPPPPAAPAAPTSSRRVLYVDDDEMMLFLAVRTLERLGYGVQGCVSAAEALAVCRQHPAPVDLVVTDLNMPDRSGLDLAADLRALHPDLPVVLSSGCVTPDLEAAAHRVGIRGILDKPTTADELATVLGRLLPKPPP